jgi:hypothetical protein
MENTTDTTTEKPEPIAGPIVREIVLTRGRVAIVDEVDYAEVSKHRWYCKAYGDYAVRNIVTETGKRTSQFLHHVHSERPHVPTGRPYQRQDAR